jgi:hypothetical protein
MVLLESFIWNVTNLGGGIFQGQHTATEWNSARDCLGKRILGAKESFWKRPLSYTVCISLPSKDKKGERHRSLLVCVDVGSSTMIRFKEIC